VPEALREAPGTGCASGFDCVFHAEAFALDDDGFRVMQQAIEDSRSQGAVVVEDFGPVLEGTVGGDHQGALLIAQADDLEEHVGAGLVDGQKAQLIEDQERGAGVFFEFGFHAAGGLGRGEGVDDIDGGGKEN